MDRIWESNDGLWDLLDLQLGFWSQILKMRVEPRCMYLVIVSPKNGDAMGQA